MKIVNVFDCRYLIKHKMMLSRNEVGNKVKSNWLIQNSFLSYVDAMFWFSKASIPWECKFLKIIIAIFSIIHRQIYSKHNLINLLSVRRLT